MAAVRGLSIALKKQIAMFVKDFKAKDLGTDWSMRDFELVTDVVQEVGDVPYNIELNKVHIDYAKMTLPSLAKLKHEPLKIAVNRVTIDVEEPENIMEHIPKSPLPPKDLVKKRGFLDYVLDGVSVTIEEVVINAKFIGAKRSFGPPPMVRIQINNLKLDATDHNWKIVDLQQARSINKGQDEAFVFRVITVQSGTIDLIPPGADVPTTPESATLTNGSKSPTATTTTTITNGTDSSEPEDAAAATAPSAKKDASSSSSSSSPPSPPTQVSPSSSSSSSGLPPPPLPGTIRIASAGVIAPGREPIVVHMTQKFRRLGSVSLKFQGDVFIQDLEVNFTTESLRATAAVAEAGMDCFDRDVMHLVAEKYTMMNPVPKSAKKRKILAAAIAAQEAKQTGKAAAIVPPPAGGPVRIITDAPVKDTPTPPEEAPPEGQSRRAWGRFRGIMSRGRQRRATSTGGGETTPAPGAITDAPSSPLSDDEGDGITSEEPSAPNSPTQPAAPAPPTGSTNISSSEVTEDDIEDLESIMSDDESAPTSPSPYFAENEDLKRNSINVSIAHGMIKIAEQYHDDTPPVDFVTIAFRGLGHTFIPHDTKTRLDNDLSETIQRIQIQEFAITEVDIAADKHPAFTTIWGRHSALSEAFDLDAATKDWKELQSGKSLYHRFSASFANSEDMSIAGMYAARVFPKNDAGAYVIPEGMFRREVIAKLNAPKMIVDIDTLQRLHVAVLGGPQGILEDKLEAKMEAMVEAALYDAVKFSLDMKTPELVIPPFGGHAGPPHIASQVLTMKMDHLSILSVHDRAELLRNDPALSQGLFVQGGPEGAAFPNFHADFSARVYDPPPPGSLPPPTFAFNATNAAVDIAPNPDTKPRSVLDPVSGRMTVAFADRYDSNQELPPNASPEVEARLIVGDITARITKEMYIYLNHITNDRLEWAPELLQAAIEAGTSSKVASRQSAIQALSDEALAAVKAVPITFHAMVAVASGALTLLLPESPSSPPSTGATSVPAVPPPPTSTSSVLASISFDTLRVLTEGHRTRSVQKITMGALDIVLPQEDGHEAPFARLISPKAPAPPGSGVAANSGSGRRPMMMYRAESLRQPPTADEYDDERMPRPRGASDQPLPSTGETFSPLQKHMWVKFVDATIHGVLDSLFQLFLYFKEDMSFGAVLHTRDLVTAAYTSYLRKDSNYDVYLDGLEFTIVDSPTTPECMPLSLNSVYLARRGSGPRKEVMSAFAEDAAFSTVLYDNNGKTLSRAPLSQSFPCRILLVRQKNVTTGLWLDDMTMDIPDMVIAISRPQMVFLMNMMDSQLKALDVVDDLQTNSKLFEDSPPAPSTRKSAAASSPRRPTTAGAMPSSMSPSSPLTQVPVESLREAPRLLPDTPAPNSPRSSAADIIAKEPLEKNFKVNFSRFSITFSKLSPGSAGGRKEFAHMDMLGVGMTWQRRQHLATSMMHVRTAALFDASPVPVIPGVPAIVTVMRPKLSAEPVGKPAMFSFEDRSTTMGALQTHTTVGTDYVLNLTLENHKGNLTPVNQRWIVDMGPVETVYVPGMSQDMKAFFTLLAEQKNLRARMNRLREEVRKTLARPDTVPIVPPPPAGATPAVPAPPSGSGKSSNGLMVFKVVANSFTVILPDYSRPDPASPPGSPPISPPAVPPPPSRAPALLSPGRRPASSFSSDPGPSANAPGPGMASKDLLYMLEVSSAVLLVSNDNLYVADDASRTDYFMKGVRVALHTVEKPSLDVLQSSQVVHPVSAQVTLLAKPARPGANAQMNVSMHVDSVRAAVSAKIYQRSLGIVQRVVDTLLARSTAHADNPAPPPSPSGLNLTPRSMADLQTSPAIGGRKGLVAHPHGLSSPTSSSKKLLPPKPAAPAPPSDSASVDRVMQVTFVHVDVSIVSDYVEELQLFLFYFKNVGTTLTLRDGEMKMLLNLRIEALINNLNFMVAETFIEPTYMEMHVAKGKDGPVQASGATTPAASPRSPRSPRDEVGAEHASAGDGSGVLDVELVFLNPVKVNITKEHIRHMAELGRLLDSLNAAAKADAEGGEGGDKPASPERKGLSPSRPRPGLSPRRMRASSNVSRGAVAPDPVLAQRLGRKWMTPEAQRNWHFNYVLINRTEVEIDYCQSQTHVESRLGPGEERSFSFANPYLSKLLDVTLRGGWSRTQGLSLDVAGVTSIRVFRAVRSKGLARTSTNSPSRRRGILPAGAGLGSSFGGAGSGVNSMVHRTVVVYVRPQGLKKFVEFLPSYQFLNSTDHTLEVRCVGKVYNVVCTCEPGEFVPVAYDPSWTDMKFYIRPSSDWSWSSPFDLSSVRGVVRKLDLAGPDGAREYLFMSLSQDHETSVVEVNFSPPLILRNLSLFPIQYYVPGEDRTGVVEPTSIASLYSDPEEQTNVSFRLMENQHWSKPVSVSKIQKTVARASRSVTHASVAGAEAGEEVLQEALDEIGINVSTKGRLSGQVARTVFLSVQYVLVNHTEAVVCVKQRGSTQVLVLPPGSRKPWSWPLSTRRGQVQVRVGDSEWSGPLGIFQSSQILEIPLGAQAAFSYQVAMTSSPVDKLMSMVTFSPRLHVVNETDLSFRLRPARSSLVLGPQETMSTIVSTTKMGLSIAHGEEESEGADWSWEEINLEKEDAFPVKISDLSSGARGRYVALDATIRQDARGLALYLSENLYPPFILQNGTPYALEVAQSSGYESTVIVPPNDSVNFYWFRPNDVQEMRVRVHATDKEWAAMSKFSGAVDTGAEIGMRKPKGRAARLAAGEARGRVGSADAGSSRGSSRSVAHMRSPSLQETRKPQMWSDAFTVDELEEFLVDFTAASTGRWMISATRSIGATVRARGKTRLVVFSLPDELGAEGGPVLPVRGGYGVGGGERVAPSRAKKMNFRFNLRLPRLDVVLATEEKREVLYATLSELNVERARSTFHEYQYVTIRDAQVDNMMPNAEFNVILSVNKRRLFDVPANFCEVLQEWTVHEDFKFLQYIGFRLLPSIMKLDGELLEVLPEFAAAARSSEEDEEEEEEEEEEGQGDVVRNALAGIRDVVTEVAETLAGRKRRGRHGGHGGGAGGPGDDKKYAVYARIADPPRLKRNITREERKKVYVETLEIFPLELHLSIGDNKANLPVVREGMPLLLERFTKTHLWDARGALVKDVGGWYVRAGLSEVYKVIGSMDLLGSPLNATRKLASGVRDVVAMPWESLVLDDTPGAFIVGLQSGATSLVYNTSDAVTMTMLKLLNNGSWAAVRLSLDKDYEQAKSLDRRLHPSNVVLGVVEGSREFFKGVARGVSGPVVQTIKGGQENGFLGAVGGFGAGVIGMPFKILGGTLDLFSKTLEGVMSSTGIGFVNQARVHASRRKEEQRDMQVSHVATYLHARNQRVVVYSLVKSVTRRARLRDRILAVSPSAIYLFNPGKMMGADYEPTCVPLANVREVRVPRQPETKCFIHLRTPVKKKNYLEIVSPNRTKLLLRLKEIYSGVPGSRQALQVIETKAENLN